MTPHDSVKPRGPNKTSWVVGLVLGLVTMSVPTLAKLVYAQIEKQDVKIEKQADRIGVVERDVIDLRIAIGRNDSDHRMMLQLLKEMRDDLKEHRQEEIRRR